MIIDDSFKAYISVNYSQVDVEWFYSVFYFARDTGICAETSLDMQIEGIFSCIFKFKHIL